MQCMNEKGIICPFRAAKVQFFLQTAMPLGNKNLSFNAQRRQKGHLLNLFNANNLSINIITHSEIGLVTSKSIVRHQPITIINMYACARVS